MQANTQVVLAFATAVSPRGSRPAPCWQKFTTAGTTVALTRAITIAAPFLKTEGQNVPLRSVLQRNGAGMSLVGIALSYSPAPATLAHPEIPINSLFWRD